jgi:uncharacterized protein YqgV (UPF0045/DUF77 family)
MLVELSIMPVGKGEGLSENVAEAVKLIAEGGLRQIFGVLGY